MSQSSPQSFRQPDQQVAKKRPVVGALLVHGLNGSRRDMAELTQMLIAHGVDARNILLPGHGTQVRDMIPLGWSDWSVAVRGELRRLKKDCNLVFLIGHSLGGALCLHMAAHEEIAGIITMCAPLHMYPWTRPLVRLARYVTPIVPTVREDVRDPEARRRYTRDVYRWTPMAPVESMLGYLPQLRSELGRITAPALIMASRNDHVVPVSDGREIYRLIGSREKHLVTFYRSYHVIMKDHDREEVFDKTLTFIQRHTEKAKLNHK